MYAPELVKVNKGFIVWVLLTIYYQWIQDIFYQHVDC